METSPAPDHLRIQQLRFRRPGQHDAVDARLIESFGQQVAICKYGNLTLGKPRQDRSTFLSRHVSPYRRRTDSGFRKNVADIFCVLHIHTEDDGASVIRETCVGDRQQAVAPGYVYNARQLTFDKVSMAHLYIIQGQVRVHAPASDGAKVTLGNHLTEVLRIADLLKYFSKSLFVAAARRGGKSHEVARRGRIKQTKVVEDATVSLGDRMVRLVDND